ncbi:arylamine N-acetyltransferase [Oleispira antarctica]|uniref:Arylamine N-acetyltransferase n=1 Tax=Oleispira antarctica TaxID=188908 RepID=A0A1Y5HUR4_OLEAN|nr:arylamine N-acetyltransferase [Oleispira antarctica]
MKPTIQQMTNAYLADLELIASTDLEFLRDLQSKHIARYSFNSLAAVLGQDISLEVEAIFSKIVDKQRGGYCFEHNKLVLTVLAELGFDVRLLMAKVIYNRDVDVARTHRVTLLNLDGDDYIVDAGFGHFGARFPVKLELGLEQDQGDAVYRIIQNSNHDYCYQVFKDDAFFTLYTFNLYQYSEAECLPAHFYSHKSPDAAFVNNLVVCRKFYNDILSLRNNEFFRISNDETVTTVITSAKQLHQILIETFELDLDSAISGFLFSKFISKDLV